jgi:hypothetical protein
MQDCIQMYFDTLFNLLVETFTGKIILICIQEKLSPEYCQKYIDKLREVIQIVIKKKGEWSNYKSYYFYKINLY